MARRKNTRFIDPRYFMNEKYERDLDGSEYEADVKDSARQFGEIAEAVAAAIPQEVAKLLQSDSLLSTAKSGPPGAHMDEKVEKSLENARRFLVRSLQKAGEKDLAEKFDGKMRNASSMGFQVSQLIYQLSSGLQSEAGRQLSEATRADYYECLEKVPQMYSANSREFGKCLDNPSAYKPPESKKRTLDDIPDIGVSRTGGPRPKDHPFNKYNPRDYDE